MVLTMARHARSRLHAAGGTVLREKSTASDDDVQSPRSQCAVRTNVGRRLEGSAFPAALSAEASSGTQAMTDRLASSFLTSSRTQRLEAPPAAHHSIPIFRLGLSFEPHDKCEDRGYPKSRIPWLYVDHI